MTTTNPTLLKMPLARDGDKTAIPETAGSTTGDFSQQYGFQQINQLPLGAGGIAPKRNDFNGVFNLLGGINFFAQKGWTFHYDSTQDYYLGCLVIDPADGKRYECIADMPAGTVAPHEDADGDYWRYYSIGDIDNKVDCNFGNVVYHRDEITTSGTYTAPVTGLYKITVTGGGGGGQGGGKSSAYFYSGHGGGYGGTTIAYKHMEAGDNVTVVIGAGGTGGASSSTSATAGVPGNNGTAGGDSKVTIDGDTYTGGGGGTNQGGTGMIPGEPGNAGQVSPISSNAAAQTAPSSLAPGAGGSGGWANNSPSAGGSGKDGIVVFEYMTPA